jgi:hypothetical protein
MMPINAMRMRNATPAANSVSYRGAGVMTVTASGTSIAVAVPAAAAVGDLLVCVVLRRSAATALPSGWTLRSAAGPYTSGTQQWSDVYTKTAVIGDLGTSPSFGQTSAGRMFGQILALYGTSATPVFESEAVGGFDNASVVVVPIPSSISAAGDGRLAVAAGTSVLASTSPTVTTFTVDNGWTMRSTNAFVDNRLGICTKPLNTSQNTAGNITTDSIVANNGMSANAVIFAHP